MKITAMQNIIKTTIIIALIGFTSLSLKAQQGNTFYFMNKVSQTNYLNPAMGSDYDFTIGGVILPIVGQVPPPIYFNYANNGFQFSDLIHEGTGTKADSLVIDPELFLANLRTANHVRFQTHVDLFHLGFKTKNDAYLSFNITEKFDYGFTLPKDLFELAWYGNNHFRENNEKIVLSDFGMRATHYREIAGGFSTEVLDGLIVGGRAKILFGMANVQTKVNELTLFTNQNDYGITAVTDMTIQANTPVSFGFDKDSLEFTYDSLAIDDFNPAKYALNLKNPGFAIDLGATYEINSDFSAYFSVNDLGFISWNENPISMKSNGTFTFRGIEVDFFESQEEFEQNMEEFTDSIARIFAPDVTEGGYLTWLPTDMYLGGQYHFHEMLDFGALYRLEFYQKNVMQSLTLSANSNLTNWLSAHLSYSIMNNSYNNLGFGFMIRGAMLQYYIVSDNIMAAFQPQHARNVNFRMGCNLVFGYKKIKSESLL
jgi:hypothetical protein